MILKISNIAPLPLHMPKSYGHLSTMNYCVLESSIVKLTEDVLAPLYFGFNSDSDEGLLILASFYISSN